MSEKITQIIEELKTLTLLEASELIAAIEETFGVDASAVSGGTMGIAAPAPIEEVEEKTGVVSTFDFNSPHVHGFFFSFILVWVHFIDGVQKKLMEKKIIHHVLSTCTLCMYTLKYLTLGAHSN